MMNVEENKAIARRFINELWNQRKYEVADEIFSEEFVTETISHHPVPWEGKGPESMKHHIQHWLVSVPDLQFHINNLIADENQIVIHWNATGTSEQPFMGIPATGKPIKLLGVTISLVENGKIALNQTILDTLGFLQQLEVLPDSKAIIERAS